MKIHILSDPGYKSGPDIRTQYFPYDVYKFIRHLGDRYDMVHYGLEGSTVDCKHYDLPKDLRSWNAEASRLIEKEKQPGDIILCYGGNTNQPATILHTDCFVVEAHIGYNPKMAFAPYKVFKSYAMLHFYYGLQGDILNISWYDRVIPNGHTPSEFKFLQDKKDYALYIGRVVESKGVRVAIEATEKAGKKLVIAGEPRGLKHLGYNKTPRHVEMLGKVGVEQRKKLLSEAECLIAPTTYIEPFGNMVVEAHMCGTPTITTDWGAFAETNIEGLTGFRPRTFKEFLWAFEHIGALDKAAIRKRALETYSDDVVYPQYVPYFEQIIKNSWYE